MGVRNDCVFSTLWPTVTRYGISWLRRLLVGLKCLMNYGQKRTINHLSQTDPRDAHAAQR